MTNVSVKYTASLNISTTKKDGRIVKVTTWTTGVANSTDRAFSK